MVVDNNTISGKQFAFYLRNLLGTFCIDFVLYIYIFL